MSESTSANRSQSVLISLLLFGSLLPPCLAQPGSEPPPKNPILGPIVRQGRLEFRPHKDGVGSLTFHPNGGIIAFESGGTVTLYDHRSEARLGSVEVDRVYAGAPKFAPNGKSFVTVGRTGQNRKLRIWAVPERDQKEITKTAEYPDPDGWLAYHPNGTLLLARYEGKTVTVAPLAGGKELFRWDAVTDPRAFSVSRNAAYLIDFGGDKTVAMRLIRWELATGRREVHEIPQRKEDCGFPKVLAVSPDGRYVAAGYGADMSEVWDNWPRGGLPHSIGIGGGAYRLDLAKEDAGHVRIWDVVAKKDQLMVRGHGGPVEQLKFSPDGRFLASIDDLGIVRLWDAAAGRSVLGRLMDDAPVRAVAFSPNGTTIATGRKDGWVRFWKLEK